MLERAGSQSNVFHCVDRSTSRCFTMHSNQNSIIFTFYLSPGNLNFISQFYRWISLEFELPENRESEWIPLERWEIFTVEFTQEFTRFNSGIHDVSLYFSVDSICLSGEFYIPMALANWFTMEAK